MQDSGRNWNRRCIRLAAERRCQVLFFLTLLSWAAPVEPALAMSAQSPGSLRDLPAVIVPAKRVCNARWWCPDDRVCVPAHDHHSGYRCAPGPALQRKIEREQKERAQQVEREQKERVAREHRPLCDQAVEKLSKSYNPRDVNDARYFCQWFPGQRARIDQIEAEPANQAKRAAQRRAEDEAAKEWAEPPLPKIAKSHPPPPGGNTTIPRGKPGPGNSSHTETSPPPPPGGANSPKAVRPTQPNAYGMCSTKDALGDVIWYKCGAPSSGSPPNLSPLKTNLPSESNGPVWKSYVPNRNLPAFGNQTINNTPVFTLVLPDAGVATFSNECGIQTLTQAELAAGAIPDQIVPCPNPNGVAANDLPPGWCEAALFAYQTALNARDQNFYFAGSGTLYQTLEEHAAQCPAEAATAQRLRAERRQRNRQIGQDASGCGDGYYRFIPGYGQAAICVPYPPGGPDFSSGPDQSTVTAPNN
jgi:hypothetical protein